MAEVKIIIDTHTLLHFKPLNEINWKELTGASTVTIVVTRVLLQELDKHKWNPRLSKRAKESISKISSGSNGFGKAITTEIPKLVVDPEIYAKFGLDRVSQDDNLLAATIAYQNLHAEDTVYLLSSDSYLILTAPHASVNILSLDDKYALNEPDESAKEIERLKRELKSAQNAIPEMSICFDDEKTHCEVELDTYNFAGYIRQRLGKAQGDYYELHENSYQVRDNHLHPNQVNIYNRLVREYHADIEAYFTRNEDCYHREIQTFPISFLLQNTGRFPAKDLKIVWTFPDEVSIDYEENSCWPAGWPYPPIILQQQVRKGEFSKERDRNYPKEYNYMIDENTMSFEVDSFRHHEPRLLDKVFVFVSARETKGFSIRYSIQAENIPVKIEGSLNVKLLRR